MQINDQIKTISFSGLNDYKQCPKLYYLSHVLKLREFTRTMYNFYGSLLHNSVQDVLLEKIDPELAAKKFERTWKKFCGIYKKSIFEELKQSHKENTDPLDYGIPALTTIRTIKEEFTKEFGKYRVLSVESWLRGKPFKEFIQDFVGKLDIAIELEDGTIIIADFKSCDSNYFFMQYMDALKESQLIYYKYFYSITNNVDPKKIETYFITLERQKRSKKPVGFIRITSGGVKTKNCLQRLYDVMGGINTGCFIKNKMACYKYGVDKPCCFKNTPHCT